MTTTDPTDAAVSTSVAPSDPALAPQFPVLDTLRAVGALAVLTTHVAFQAGDYGRHGTVGTVLARLDIGVAIFLVLSGFLLSRPFLARAALGLPAPPVRTYYLKRFWRIYPVYAVAVVVTLLVVDQDQITGIRGWLLTLTLSNTFVDPVLPNGLTQMWSLGVEVTFYVVLPLLALLATGRHRTGLRASRTLLVVAAMAATGVWWHLDGQGRAGELGIGSPVQWLPGYLTWFAAGIALALAHVLHTTGSRSGVVAALLSLGRQPGVCWSLAAALLLAASTPISGPTGILAPGPAESLTKNVLYAVIASLLVLTGVAADPASRFGQTLGHHLPRHLGLISYSVFCLHQLVLDLVARALDLPLFGGYGVQLWLLTVAASLVAAEAAYRLVEVPGMRLRTILAPRPPVRSGAGPAEPTEATMPATDTTDR